MNKPTALGCYIFAGGFTVGVRKHFDVLAHFEEGPYGTETAARNFPELRGNIFTDPTTWPVADFAGRVDFVYGNPPCAPWSVCSAGRKVPWRLDPRVGCAQRLYGLLSAIRPKVWAFESVRPTFSKGRELIDDMVLKGLDFGYRATALMVEGTRHGVPQRRPRFFLVLSRIGQLNWAPTGRKHVPTVGEAFAEPFASFTCTKEGSPFFLNLVRKTKPGVRVAALFNQLYPERVAEGERTGEWVKGRPSFQNIRLDADQPSCTLTGGAKQIHPTEHRFISIEESAVLCGYPRSFKFLGSIGKQYQQVAQAVMPPVGEYLARIVAAGIALKKSRDGLPFERVEVFTDRLERSPLEAQLPLDFDPKKVTSLPPKEGKMARKTEPAPAIAPSVWTSPPKPEKPKSRLTTGDGRRKLKAASPTVTDGKTTVATKPVSITRAGTRRLIAAFERAGSSLHSSAGGTMWVVLEHCAAAGIAVKIEGNPELGWTIRRLSGSTDVTRKESPKAKPGVDKPNRRAIAREESHEAAKVEGPPKRGSGARIRELLQKGWDVERILATIHKEFPQSKAQKSDVAWNRRKLEQEGAAA